MLQVKLTVSSVSQDGTEITIQDTTGAYNAGTNPGGYGAPNPTSGEATLAMLRYSTYGNRTVNKVYPIGEFIAGKVFSDYELGLTSDPDGTYLIPDGVNVFEYLVGYSTSAVTIDGKIVDVTGIALPANLKYVSFSGSNDEVYEVVQQTSTKLVLNCAPEAADGETLIAFYNAASYVLVDTHIQKLIDQKVVTMPDDCETSIELMEDVLNLQAATARFSLKDYLGANLLVTTLNKRYADGRYRV